jgi:hypothetical protein
MTQILKVLLIGFIITNHQGVCQNKLLKACEKLKKVAFKDNYNYENIKKATSEYRDTLFHSTNDTYIKCNCADIFWIELLNDKESLTTCDHCSLGENRGDYLHYLVTLIDEYNLEYEFSILHLRTAKDSFDYVMKRIEFKRLRREMSKNNWRTFYHIINPEANFLKDKRWTLTETYLKYFDDTSNTEYNRDLMLTSFFETDESIEPEMIKRMSNQNNNKYFWRMVGILGTSGSNNSIRYLTSYLQNQKLELKELTIILSVIYEIKSSKIIEDGTWNSFKQLHKNTTIDSLVKANYFEEYYKKPR